MVVRSCLVNITS